MAEPSAARAKPGTETSDAEAPRDRAMLNIVTGVLTCWRKTPDIPDCSTGKTCKGAAIEGFF
jgi:hypothetical protein